MKLLVQLISIALICINIAIFFYVQIMQAKLYSIAIILSCSKCITDLSIHWILKKAKFESVFDKLTIIEFSPFDFSFLSTGRDRKRMCIYWSRKGKQILNDLSCGSHSIARKCLSNEFFTYFYVFFLGAEKEWTIGTVDYDANRIHCFSDDRNDRFDFVLFYCWSHFTKWNCYKANIWHNCHTIRFFIGHLFWR